MRTTLNEITNAVRAAGKATQQTEHDNAVNLDHVKPTGGAYSTDPTVCTAPDFSKNAKDFSGGFLPTTAHPESPYSYGLADIKAHSLDIKPELLSAVGRAWFKLSAGLARVFEQLSHDISTDLGNDGSWSGVAADSMRSGISQYIASGTAMSTEANQAGNTVMRLCEQLGTFKARVPNEPTMDSLSPTMTLPAQLTRYTQQQARLTQMARDAMSALYVPGITDAGGAMPKPTDPYNPVIALPTPASSSSGSGGGVGGFASLSGGGGSGGGGSAVMALREDSRASAAAKAAADANTLGPSSTSPGIPESPSGAASSNGLADAVEGGPGSGLTRGGVGGADSNTDLAPSELAALHASPTASAMGGGTGGAAGAGGKLGSLGSLGGVAGAGGVGGGAGALGAANEAKLAQRAAAAESLAAREAAAARASASAGSSAQSGAPVASRAAGAAGGGDKDKGHKPSKLLQSVKNGEEILGESSGTAPAVIDGPLNLSYDTDTPQR
ncbi:hypothetical protein [Gordonia jinhuaensis]|nr:hypothetical protein [Gordonia jinhuaensis]